MISKIKYMIALAVSKIRDFMEKEIKAPVWAILTIAFAIFASFSGNLALMTLAVFTGYQWGVREAARDIMCDECGVSLLVDEPDEMVMNFERH